jgi:trk system potassium uptake protein TrkH
VDWRTVLSVLSYLLLILALCLLAPLAVSIIYHSGGPYEVREIVGFALTSVLSLGGGLALRHSFRHKTKDVGRREGFAIVTCSWLVAVIVGMIPFLVTGVTTSVTDAFFEVMSGFTTTGATVFGHRGAEIENIPHGLQFWRCMTQWLGGMGIVVLSVALLSFLGVGGYRLLKAEAPGGVAYERERPRITDAAKDLWKLYLGISAAEVIALKLSGTTIYDAFCHTFTTMSTGGFSPHGESIAYFGPATQWIIIVFMFLAGMNFSLHAQLFRGRPGPVVRNSEFRMYAGIMVVCTAIGVLTVSTGNGVEERVRDVAFQVVSIGTTTGYATKDYDIWPQHMRLLLLLLMFAGGCMGSTGGGIKAARIVIYAKALVRELHRLIFPHGVRPIRTGDKVVDTTIVRNILAFGTIYVTTFLVGMLVMAAFGYDLISSASASAAALGNIGPGMGAVGPTTNWAHLPAAAKWFMSLLMLLGRLELFSVLILMTPWAWKR